MPKVIARARFVSRDPARRQILLALREVDEIAAIARARTASPSPPSPSGPEQDDALASASTLPPDVRGKRLRDYLRQGGRRQCARLSARPLG